MRLWSWTPIIGTAAQVVATLSSEPRQPRVRVLSASVAAFRTSRFSRLLAYALLEALSEFLGEHYARAELRGGRCRSAWIFGTWTKSGTQKNRVVAI